MTSLRRLGNDLLSFYGVDAPVSAGLVSTSDTIDVDDVFEPVVQPLTRDRRSGQLESYNANLSEVNSTGMPSTVQVLQQVPRYDYMYDRFEDQLQSTSSSLMFYAMLLFICSVALTRVEQVIGTQIAARHGIEWKNENVEEAEVDQELTVFGRIVHRNKDGLTPNSAMSADSVGILVNNKVYRLDMLSAPQVVLVPGMHVAVKVVKVHTTRLRAIECWTNAALTPAPMTTRNTRVLIAAGPYTARTDLRYEGLELLFSRIRTTLPDVVLLVSTCQAHVIALTRVAARSIRRCRTPSRARSRGDVPHCGRRILRPTDTHRSTRHCTPPHTVRARAFAARCSPAVRISAAVLFGK